MNWEGCGREKKASNDAGGVSNLGVSSDASKGDAGDCWGFGEGFSESSGVGEADVAALSASRFLFFNPF